MGYKTLQDRLDAFESPLKMLRDSPHKLFKLAYERQFSNWRDEQAAWTETAILLNQSNHMNDVYFKGPDVVKLLSDTSINSYKTFGRNKAKQIMVCAPDGNLIGTAVLFGLEDDEVNIVGPAACANWIRYQAEIGNYDVEIDFDARTKKYKDDRKVFRYEIEGPTAMKIMEKAHGGPMPDTKFFGMIEFEIAGRKVRALKHTMAGKVGSDSHGYEFFGAAEDEDAVMDVIRGAGEEFGLVEGGALTYYSSGPESGYLSQPVPAIYAGEEMRPYREWLSGEGYEAKMSVGGSYLGEAVEDYYRTPYDMDYTHILKFDHDFIGRDALEKIKDEPHNKKVWLKWNDDDAMRVIRSSLMDEPSKRAKFLDYPLGRYSRVCYDHLFVNGEKVGISTMPSYTVNVGGFFSLAMIKPEHAVTGTESVILWGEENGGTAKLGVERHAQTEIRATVHEKTPFKN